MSKIVQFSVLIFFIFIVRCSGMSKYNDNEIAAMVKGQEITIGDLRFLYPDDTALNYLNWAIKVELVKQKVEEMDLDVSDYLSDERDGGWFGELPPKDTNDEGGKQIRKFATSQAKKLNMKPEEFQREYAKKIEEQNAYLATYLAKELGVEKFDLDQDMVTFYEEVDYLLEELVAENKGEIKVLMK